MQASLRDDKEHLSRTFADLSESGGTFDAIEFEGCRFEDCDFTGAVFRNCKFDDCVFSRCNLSVAKVPHSRFTEAAFDECKLSGVDWTVAAWPRLILSVSLRFTRCILNDASFFGLALDKIVLTGCTAHDVDFRDGSFRDADFSSTDFANSLFNQTNLTRADFTGAVNYTIDLFNNKIGKAKFSRPEAVRLLDGLDIELVD